jgi:DNA-binding transcriptional LysR family regulator
MHDAQPWAHLDAIPVEALCDHPVILARDARHAARITDVCRANGFEPRIGQRAADIVSGLAMTANGLGVSIVPESVRTLQLPRLVYRPLEFKSGANALIELQCAYRRGETSPLLAEVLAVVRSYRHEREQRGIDRHAVP